VLENPFVGCNIGANGARDKMPGVVGDQRSKLFFHGVTQTEEGNSDKVDAEVADRVSLWVGSQKLHFPCVVIG
jgi:hypothetical protein